MLLSEPHNDNECKDDVASQRSTGLVYVFEKWRPAQAHHGSPDKDKLLFNCTVIGKAALEAW